MLSGVFCIVLTLTVPMGSIKSSNDRLNIFYAAKMSEKIFNNMIVLIGYI